MPPPVVGEREDRLCTLVPPRREPEYSLPRKGAYGDDPVAQPRLVMAPDDAPVLHLGRQPPGTVYVLPPGSLVMLESR